jgi:pilus assembly protein FimV
MIAAVSVRRLLVAVALAGGAAFACPVGAQTPAPQVRIEAASGAFEAVARINLRQLPNPQAKRLGVLNAGEAVQVTGKVAGTQWVAVLRADGLAGFVLSDLLRPVPTPTAAPVPAAAPVAADAPPAAAPPPVAETPPPPPPAPPVENELAGALARRLAAVEEQLARLAAQDAAAQKSDAARDETLRAVVAEQQALARTVEAMRTELAEPQSLRPVNERLSALSARMDQALAQVATAQEAAAAQLASARNSIAALAGALADAAPERREAAELTVTRAIESLRAEMAGLSQGSQQASGALVARVDALAEEFRLYKEQQAAGLWPQATALAAGVWEGARQGAQSLWSKAASLWW